MGWQWFLLGEMMFFFFILLIEVVHLLLLFYYYYYYSHYYFWTFFFFCNFRSSQLCQGSPTTALHRSKASGTCLSLHNNKHLSSCLQFFNFVWPRCATRCGLIPLLLCRLRRICVCHLDCIAARTFVVAHLQNKNAVRELHQAWNTPVISRWNKHFNCRCNELMPHSR